MASGALIRSEGDFFWLTSSVVDPSDVLPFKTHFAVNVILPVALVQSMGSERIAVLSASSESDRTVVHAEPVQLHTAVASPKVAELLSGSAHS